MKKILFLVLLISVLCCPLNNTFAEIPHLINYQGRLTDTVGIPLNGSYNLTFRIYDAETAGNLLWEETQTGIVINKGIFAVLLGSVTNLNLSFDKPYFLEIKVGNEVMSPRQRIASGAYALRSEKAEALTIPGQKGDILCYDGTDWTKLEAGVSGQFLKTQGAGQNPIWSNTTNNQLFTSSGTFTIPEGITKVFITMCAGGGGGGGGATGGYNNNWGGGGGGGGGFVINCPYEVVPGNTYTVTIGNGGSGGGVSGDGSPGGSTTFATLSVPGGSGGTRGITGTSYSSIGSAGIGGTGGSKGGLSAASGNNGQGGETVNGTNNRGGSGGEASGWGIGGSGGASYVGGTNGTGYGSGGGGGGKESNGGTGAPGFVSIQW